MITDFLRYHVLFFTRRICFCKDEIGKEETSEDGKVFKVFLHVVNRNKFNTGSRRAKLKISFRVKRMSLFQRVILPIASTPFFAGCPGFVSKKFLVCEKHNLFQGSYEWENEEYVRNYVSSYAMRFMRRISIPGSIRYDIIP
jgi:hypothetical protein